MRRESPPTVLARRYGRLLRCYPTEYRARRGDEIIGTLLDAAAPGQRWPSLREAAELVRYGLHRRLRAQRTPELAAGLRIAGPVALGLAGALAAFLWLSGESAPFRTVGPVLYAAWLVAVAGNAVLPWAAVRRDLLAGATVATLLAIPTAAVTGQARPPVWVVATLALCGTIALTGCPTGAPAPVRYGVAAGALAGGGLCAAALWWWLPDGARASGYYGVTLRVAGLLALAVIAGVAVAGALAGVRAGPGRGRGQWRPWGWTVLALGLPAAWVVGVDGTPLAMGRLGQFLLTASAVVTAMAMLAGRGTATGLRHVAGPTAAAFAAGLSGYFWVAGGWDAGGWNAGRAVAAYAAWLSLAVGWAVLPGRWARALAPPAVALTMTAGLPRHQVTALVAAGAVALCGGRRSATVPAAAVAVFALAAGVGAYAHNWHPSGWRELFAAGDLVATLGVVPAVLGVAILVTWPMRKVRNATRRPPSATTPVS